MTPLIINDNSEKAKSEFVDIEEGLIDQIKDKTLDELMKKNVFLFPYSFDDIDDLSKDQFILQTVNNNYKAGNVMGFIGNKNQQLIIRSRFTKENDNDFFFQYMLEKVFNIPNILKFDYSSINNEPYLNILLFIFPYYLKRAVKKGLLRKYIRLDYNDSNVKGTIDIARHIKLNTPFLGKIAYSQREYSSDNDMTELIRHTIEYIKGKSYGNRILKSAQDEVDLISKVTKSYNPLDRRKVITRNKKNRISHAYYHEYRYLQILCIQILEHQNSRLSDSNKNNLHGILFDGAWLWEEYIYTLIEKEFYHPRNKKKDGAEHLFYNEKNARHEGSIYPDFISKNSEARIIADAKYKPEDNIGSGNKDYFQLLAYMYRFDSKEGYFFYPEIDDANVNKLLLLKGLRIEDSQGPRDEPIKLIKYGFKIPKQVQDYSEFKNAMMEEEKAFKSSL